MNNTYVMCMLFEVICECVFQENILTNRWNIPFALVRNFPQLSFRKDNVLGIANVTLSRFIFVHSQVCVYHRMFHTGSFPVRFGVTDTLPDGPLGECFKR